MLHKKYFIYSIKLYRAYVFPLLKQKCVVELGIKLNLLSKIFNFQNEILHHSASVENEMKWWKKVTFLKYQALSNMLQSLYLDNSNLQ